MKVEKTIYSVILLVVVFCVVSLCDFPSVMEVSYSDSQRGGCEDCADVDSKVRFTAGDCPSQDDCEGSYLYSFNHPPYETGETLDVIIIDDDPAECTGNPTCEAVTQYGTDSNCDEVTY